MRAIRFFFQRRIRGWDDSETWNLDYTIANFIVTRLKRYKELNNGIPPDLNEQQWDDILDKMIASFELRCYDYREDFENASEEREAIITEGLNLFSKHFEDLWW
jgi:hypothetical protein